ncbi:MAG: DUF1491 family protein [Micavibrio aeruginosavorus]|uniref:DUF1491 family protein n=1 Tax=Micavibrio aeruginosavorus TaxID=349221 RepID=A0A7T5UFU7_9BACT|nr:MAG: DUF1491 family protein [Micavibrio aeruginosavorus]
MSQDDRIPIAVWIDAHLRKWQADGRCCYILNKGAYASGTILLKINLLGPGCLLLQQQRNLDGDLGWMKLLKGGIRPETEADDYICRAIDRDPDLWVIEIEDREGLNPFEGKIF